MPRAALIIISIAAVCVAGCSEPESSRLDLDVFDLEKSSQSNQLGYITEQLDAKYGSMDTRDSELRGYDDQLNATYRTLVRQLNPEDKALLRKAQRAWIVFRDADCEVAYVDKRDCLIARTEERETQLRSSLYFDRDGGQIEFSEEPI